MALVLKAASPAQADRAVVFAVDAHYLPFAIFAARRIAWSALIRDYDICVVLTDPGDLPPCPATEGIRFGTIETSGLYLDRRRTASVHARLLLPEAMASDHRRILHLDADVFLRGGDLSGLPEVDLGPNAVAAVRDNIQWRTPGRKPEAYRRHDRSSPGTAGDLREGGRPLGGD